MSTTERSILRPPGKAAPLALLAALACLTSDSGAAGAPAEAGTGNSPAESLTRQWVERWGDKMTERYHPDIQEAYPGGRSDRYQDAYVDRFLREFGLPPNTNWKEINKHYAFDGDWFIVEYLFQAEDKKTGQLQREGTLFFGRVTDDRLIVGIEYFDRLVKQFQHAGALPPFLEDEMPFPWPDYDGLTRKYRP
jgi:hypothetical protein